MKTRLIHMAIPAVAAAIVSCSDSYPGLEYENDGQISNNEVYDKTPIMMFINEQSYFSISATRGTGVFEDENMGKYENSVFHIFAFRDGHDTYGPLTAEADLRKTTSLAGGAWHDPDNADCLVDGEDYLAGLPARLSSDRNGTLEPQTGGILYYSSMYQDVGYNFFAYHIDDFSVTGSNTHRNEDEIYYDLEIDGSQDIMCGHAPEITPDLLERKISGGKLTISAADRAKILNIGNYSTFAAHRGINPEIELKHRLTRMRFLAYPGDKSADSIRITGITVESRYRGKMVVAARNRGSVGLTFGADKKALPLREASPDGLQKCPGLKEEGYVVRYDDSMEPLPWNQRPELKIGESLMLAPDSVYTVTLYYTQTVSLGNGKTADRDMRSRYVVKAQENSYYLDGASGMYIFRPGYLYTVKIVVYGLQPIKVSANVEGWHDGGDIEIDPDKSDEAVIK